MDQTARQLADLFMQVADLYEEAIRGGCDQRTAFETIRDKFIEAGIPPMQAANLTRCMLAMIAKRNGQQLYTEAELAEILRRALGRDARKPDLGAPKFHPGRCTATPAALKAIEHAGQVPGYFLDRHVRGDWGEVCDDDKAANDRALQDGSRLLSAYRTLRNERLWILTEAAGDDRRRASTTILLPEEY